MHWQGTVSVMADNQKQRCSEDLAGDENRDQPPGDDLAPGQAEQGGQDVEPVCERVEQLADARDLVVVTGDLSVEIVAHAREHQDQQGPVVLVGQDEPQEDGNADQSQHGQDVGWCQDSVTDRAFPLSALVHLFPHVSQPRRWKVCP